MENTSLQKEKVGMQLRNFLEVNVNSESTIDKALVDKITNEFAISQDVCNLVLKSYQELLICERAKTSVYRSYINNTTGSVDYENSIERANNDVAIAQKRFDLIFNFTVLLSFLNKMKLEYITLDVLEEMYQKKISVTDITNVGLAWVYKSYINTREKRSLLLKTLKK